MSAQVSFTPSTLTWSADDTSAKTVTVHSPGWWDTDSTSHSSHFNLSRYNGWNGYEIEIAPLSTNNSGGTITEDIPFTTPGSPGTYYLHLVQTAVSHTLNVSPSSIYWNHDATDSRTVTVTSNASWRVTSDADWVTLNSNSGSGNGTVSISLSSANILNTERTAMVNIRVNGSLSRSVSLRQGANPNPITDISVTPSLLEWDAEDTSVRTVTVASPGRWHTDSTASIPSYFILSSYDGQPGSTLSISPAGKNRTDVDISEEIVLWESGGDGSAVLHLRQGSWKNTFSAYPTSLVWGSTETTWKTVSVECPSEWTASIVGDGFALTNGIGSGAGTIRVCSTVMNPSSRPRSASLVISGGDIHRTVMLIQEGTAGGYSGGAGSTGFAEGESLQDYDPGITIPYERSAGNSGAVVYSVPAATAPGLKNIPGLNLAYSSLGSDGLAGYGWEVGGVSGISVTNKTAYYDGVMAAANADSPDAVYSLDGVRLVPNSITTLSNTWQYETASGHVIVKKHTDAQGRALWFEAMYPNGMRATFGSSSASAPSVSYPISESRDIDGNWIRYTYGQDSNTDDVHLVRAEYGLAGSTAVQASIELEYGPRTDWHARYLCGRSLGHSVILKGITSLNGADTLRHYSFVHENSCGVQMLTRIGCTAGNGREASPLRFSYGKEGATEAVSLIQGDCSILERAFPDARRLVAVRGKFRNGSYNDGVILYPEMPSYAADQKILVVPRIRDFESTVHNGIQTGSNFIGVYAVDVIGDGADEIVKLNDGQNLQVSVYKEDDYGRQTNLSETSYTLSGTSGTDVYYWGDFLGNGRTQLAVVRYDRDNPGENPASVYFIDLYACTMKNGGTVFQDGIDNLAYVFSTDVDADGTSELCRFTSTGMEMWHASASTGSFSLYRTVSGINRSALSSGRRMYQTDLNGDGYLDIVVSPYASQSWDVYQFNGMEFVHTVQSMGTWSQSSEYMFLDVDQDGLADLVRRNGSQVSVYPNRNGVIGTELVESPVPVSPDAVMVPCNTVNYGASSSLVFIDGFIVRPYKFDPLFPDLHLMSGSCGSLGECATYGYKYGAEDIGEDVILTKSPGYEPVTSLGYVCRTMPVYLVSHEKFRDSETSTNSLIDRSFKYRSAVMNTRGLGFCGFRDVETVEYKARENGFDKYVHVVVSNPENRGVPELDVRGVNGSEVARMEYTFDTNISANGILNPRLLSVTSTDALTGVTTMASYTYDTYDCPVGVTETKSTGSGSPIATTTSTVYSHSITPSLYLLGTPSVTTVTKGATASKTEYTLDTLKRPTGTKSFAGSVSGGGTVWSLAEDRQVSYDARGNVTSDRTAKYGATAYNETTYTYDAAGRYIISSTDPLGRTTTYQNYNKYGTPLTSTNFLGQNTVVSCDAWGNAVQTTYPDGTVESTTRAWSASGEPGVLCVTKTASGRPTMKAWYDALGRELCSAEQRFDGVWMRSFTEYDTRGRVSRKSLPLRDDAHGSYLWNTYGYDSYDRPVSFTEASGKQTSWSYSGTSTTTTKDGMSSTSTTDAAGNVVSVTDGGGTITYALRDDGQPSGVTVTPLGSNQGVVTTFQYDAYGRRTAMIDPSAGTRTDTYTDNADGTSSIAHTGPNGTVTTNHDRFGRVTSVTRPEFSTSYTYGTTLNSSSYGKLLSETSTNGTSRSFTYDNYGRTASETEYADATHWLRKVYGYGAGSNIASIAYATQDGSITTEAYSYANGHNTGISLPDGTVVYALTEESDMGQPAGVTSGGATRAYGYTETGIPSMRSISNSGGGTVQHFEYSYAPLTGNMNWRRDNVLCYKETFSYDALNRLLSSVQEATADGYPSQYNYDHAETSYSPNGNTTFRSNDGVLECFIDYGDGTDPYKATGNYAMGSIPDYYPEYFGIAVTSFDRPGVIMSGTGNYTTTFTYDAGGERTKMSRDEDAYGIHMDRYYLGGVYEKDDWRDGCTEDAERLFLGGSAYDAPMVLVKAAGVNNGAWTPFNIGRDVQGSITEVLTVNGDIVEQFRYDPWGLMLLENEEEGVPEDPLDPDGIVMELADTLAALSPWQWAGKSVYVGGHGYTGHEHLPGFGLINCNARLYDPALGRFLMPDPLIQDPASTQNYNRYSYCLNNPLKYTDESGEFWNYVIGAVLGGLSNVLANWDDIKAHGFWTGVGYFGIGAAIGVLSSGASIWTANAVEACGIVAGSLVGSVSGALTGGGTATLTNGLNNCMHGSGFFDNWWQETKSSFISGAISGAISGGIQGYKYAKEHGANPFTNKVEGRDVIFEKEVKTGIPPQNNPEEYCYAHSAAYADVGHGNHTVNEYIAAAKGAKGYDVSVLTDVSPSVKYVDGGLFSELSDNVMKLGVSLYNPNLEIMATISGGENKHWVNIFKIVASEKMHLFGGGRSVVPSLIGYWDPATGLTNTTTYIIDYKVYKF